MSILKPKIRIDANVNSLNASSAGIQTLNVFEQSTNSVKIGSLTLSSYTGASPYGLVFPPTVGILGQTLATDGTGSMYWQNPPYINASVLTVTKNPGPGEFGNLTDCITYINTQLFPPPSSTNPVCVNVFPGIFNEVAPVSIPSWVNIIGQQVNSVIFNNNFTCASYSTLKKLTINGIVSVSTLVGISLTECILKQQVIINGPSDGTFVTMNTCSFIDFPSIGLEVQSGMINVTSTIFSCQNTSPTEAILVTGGNCVIGSSTFELYGNSQYGIVVDLSGSLIAYGCNITYPASVAIYNPPTSFGVSMTISSFVFVSCPMYISVNSTSTSGFYAGTIPSSTYFIVSGSTFYITGANITVGVITGGTGYFDTVVGNTGKFTNLVFTGTSGNFISLTGVNTWLTNVSGTNEWVSNLTGITGYFTSISGGTGYFTSLGTSSFVGNSINVGYMTGTNLWTVTHTGVNSFITNEVVSVMTGGTGYFNSINASTGRFSTLTGGTGYFTNVSGNGNFTNITGVNMWATNATGNTFAIANLIGGAGFFSSLTGSSTWLANATGTNVWISNLTGSTGYFNILNSTTITGGTGYITQLALNENAVSPSSPTSGQLLMYAKTDNLLYLKTPSGTETVVGNGITNLTGDVSATGPGTVSSIVNYVGGVTASAIASFTNNANIIRVNKDGSGNFTSVYTAMNSIGSTSPTNTFSIIIGPGIFTEPQIVFKSWVWVSGQKDECTVIQTNNYNQHAIVGADNAGISKVTVTGATGVGYAGVFYQSSGASFEQAFYVYDIRFGSNYIQSLCDTTNGTTVLVNLDSRVGAHYTFTYGFVCQDSGYGNAGRNEVFETSSTGNIPAPEPTDVFLCNGPKCEIIAHAFSIYAATTTTGNFIHALNGGTIRMTAGRCKNFGTGLFVEDTGTGPTLDIQSISFISCTQDINIAHPSCMGSFSGVCNKSKVTINPSSPVSVVFSDDGNVGIGQVVVKDIYQGDDFSKIINVSKLLRVGTTVGTVSGGALSYTAGLSINVASGDGFLVNPLDQQVYEITWGAGSVPLVANNSNYVYVTPSGILTSSTAFPIYDQVIYLGRVVTGNSSVEYAAPSIINMNQQGDAVETSLRLAFGPIYVGGSTVTEDAIQFELDITSGSYYYGSFLFTPIGGTPVVLNTRYRDGYGGWINSTGFLVNYTQYDNNSTGGLVSLSTGYYAKHSLYTGGQGALENYILFIAQAQYQALAAVQTAPLPTPSPDIIHDVALIADIIVQQGTSNITQIDDQRPRVGFKPSSITATADHLALLNLTTGNAGHTQFVMLDGSTSMSGNLKMNSNSITGAINYNGVVVEAHESRHTPNGEDPLPTASPITNLSPSSTNATGVQNTFARSDHSHAITGFQASGNYITGLSGDVVATGPNGVSSTVLTVGGSSASNIHTAEVLANASTNLNTASTIVKRDSSGNFSAGLISSSISGFTGTFGGITASTGYFSNLVSSVSTGGTGYFIGVVSGIISGSTGFFSNITGSGGYLSVITASTGYVSGMAVQTATGSTSYFSNSVVGSLTGTTGYFSGNLSGGLLVGSAKSLRRFYTTSQQALRVNNWTTGSSIPSLNWISICWSEELGTFCSVSQGSHTVIVSQDGSTWKSSTTGITNDEWNAVCWSPERGIFCSVAGIVGTPSVNTMTSSDGITWSNSTSGVLLDAWVSVCWSSGLGLFCAIANSSANTMKSSDGIHWSNSTSGVTPTGWTSVCWSPELEILCAVSTSQNTMTSTDGINWTNSTTAPNSNWTSVCWSSELGIFCSTSTSGYVMLSADGVIWVSYTLAIDPDAVCWSSELGLFCAVSNGNGIAVSIDGQNWVTTSVVSEWMSVCWSPELGIFCTVSQSPAVGISEYVKQTAYGNGGNRRFNQITSGEITTSGGITGTTLYLSSTGTFSGGITGTTGYFSNMLTSAGGITGTKIYASSTGTFSGGLTASTGYFTNQLILGGGATGTSLYLSSLGIFAGGTTGTTSYNSGTGTFAGGLTATTGYFFGVITNSGGITSTTGYFSNMLITNGITGTFEYLSSTGTFAGGLTATTGYFTGMITATGGITGTTSYHSGTGYFSGGITGTTGVFGNSVTVVGALSAQGTGSFGGGITATTGYFSNSVTVVGALSEQGTGSFGGGITATTGYFTGMITATGGITGTTTYHSGTGYFAGGLTGSTGYFSNLVTVTGTGSFGGGITATTGYFSNLLTTTGGITGTTTYHSGTGYFAGGLTGSTGYFSNLVTVTGTGSFGGGITATTGYFTGMITATGGITGTTTYHSGTGYFSGGLTGSTGYFSNLVTVTGTGSFGGGITATTGYFSNLLTATGGFTGSTGTLNSLSMLTNTGIKIYDSSNSGSILINTPSSISPAFTMTLPPNMGSSGYFMRNTNGVLGFMDYIQPENEVRFSDDFMMITSVAPYGDYSWSVNSAGGGSTSTPLFSFTGWGVTSLTTGGAATNFYNISMTGMNFIPSATENILVGAGIQIPTAYGSTGVFTVGFGDSRAATSDTNAICFSYHSNGDGNWYGVCSKGGFPSTGTGTALSIGSFMRLQIYGNSSGMTFYVNGTSLGTISSNIPSTGIYPLIRAWSTNAGAKSMYVDYFKFSRFNSSTRY
jgi:hypothetical protein